MNKKLLEIRLAIIMAKENCTFTDSLNKFQQLLQKKFNEDYSLDEIENALHELEDNYLENIYNEEKESLVLVKEDFELKEIKQWQEK